MPINVPTKNPGDQLAATEVNDIVININQLVDNPTPGPEGPQGPAGPAGADGATGPQGDPGIPGADGATGPQGPVGPGGSASQWRSGSGVPNNTLGLDGDFYINSDNGDVYQRITGNYALQLNIIGAQGIQGPAGTNGVDGAQGPAGNNGLDGSDGAQGPQGIQGPAGNDGAQGIQGIQGLPGAHGQSVNVVSGTTAPNDADGQPDGTIYIQTA